MSRAPRLVLDTNVVLSALLFANGRLAPLRRAWQSRRIVCLASADTLSELVRVLGYPKFRLTVAECDELLADYLPGCETVPMPERLPKLPECRDPADRPFLALAVVARADALVTGDRDLLALAGAAPVEIVTPDEALRRLAALPTP